ncbi:lysophospholipase [Paenibacillus filicis]|uniref:Lysophospholipase n=1 Tax=Paenibacillus gyeongsangnamensis TaxID=3388067 RepID=A0ABT4Q9R6_9BACL|nr:alpha/beta hydrolase [Paenibacillus filicis]MCZ8513502.1 lysophospholipase [Paenibacillus filicis]
MHKETFTIRDGEGQVVYVYNWQPAVSDSRLLGAVQIAHGMAETAARYERFAQRLVDAGFTVYANDHLGHGQTAGCVEKLGLFAQGCFTRMTDHMANLTDRIAERHPGLPVFLLGHSMGSFIAQQYMYRYPCKIEGVVLSGSNGREGFMLKIGHALAKLEVRRRGEDHRSLLLNGLTFGTYNRRIKPVRTPFDWLSRDEAEVDKYIADEYCGAIFSTGFFQDFFCGLLEIHKPEHLAHIPKRLPVFILSGDEDPVGHYGKGIRQLACMYAKLGLEQVTVKLYPGGRHEMLNETNREEVMQDIIDWLHARVLGCGEK